MKPRINQRGQPDADYTGAHVTLLHDGRQLLGTIVYVCPDEHLCEVRHFNGEIWPLNPSLTRLEILERTHESEEL